MLVLIGALIIIVGHKLPISKVGTGIPAAPPVRSPAWIRIRRRRR
jgi:hypothetical protein